jgi:hypothetical protein
MNDLARKRLCDLLATYGPAICNTPRSCEMFIRQNCSECPDELQLITKALHGGIVPKLMALRNVQDWEATTEPFVGQIVEAGGVTPEAARWTVDTWGIALRKHPDAAGAPAPAAPLVESSKRLDVRSADDSIGSRLTITVAICGGTGGAIGGMLIGAMIELFGKLIVYFTQLEPGEVGLILAIVAVVSGASAGAAGAAAGWLCIGGHKAEDMPVDGTLPRWVIQGYISAFGGALSGAALGGALCHVIAGVLIFGFLGGFTGAFSGVLRK